MSATSAIPWLPTTGMQVADEPSLAEQVAMMLHAERQVMILITGSDSGRLSGFLADLTHAASHADTVLRIKAAIDVEALFILLAGQMNLPTQNLTTMQLATQVGERLQEKAPNGNFVLLCEGAQAYSSALLESIRQLSNYPINIVLSGRPKLLRRLWWPGLRALKQRLNYQLELTPWEFTHTFKWLFLLMAVSAALIFAWRWIAQPAPKPSQIQPQPLANPSPVSNAPSRIVIAPRPINVVPAEPVKPASEEETGLSLVMEPTLKQAPKK